MGNYQEKSLIFLAKNGNEEALTYIYKKYVKEIHYYFETRIKTKEEAKDLTQDVFIAFIDSLERFKADSGIRTYLYGIAKNILCNHYKASSKIYYDSKFVEQLQDEDEVLNVTDNSNTKDKQSKLLDDLSIKEKEELESKVIMGSRHSNIAKRLGISVTNSRQILKRAINKIKDKNGK